MRGWTDSPGSSRKSAEPEAMKLYMLDLSCLRHRSRVGVVGVKDSCGLVVSRCCSWTQGESTQAPNERERCPVLMDAVFLLMASCPS